jgi:hypothetical protein
VRKIDWHQLAVWSVSSSVATELCSKNIRCSAWWALAWVNRSGMSPMKSCSTNHIAFAAKTVSWG